MIRTIFCVLALSLLHASAPPKPADVQGRWTVAFAIPGRPDVVFEMGVIQNGTKLTGHLASSSGEFQMKGTVEGDAVTIIWSILDGGRAVQVTFKGQVVGDIIDGTATMGNSAEGQMHAERLSQT